MAISLNKDVDRIFLSLCIHMEEYGPPFTEEQTNILQQALEFAYKSGYLKGKEQLKGDN